MTDEMIEEALDAVSVWSRVENATSERQIAEHAIKAYLAILAKAGMGIRPREPTEEMDRAARPVDSVRHAWGTHLEFWQALWDAHKPDY